MAVAGRNPALPPPPAPIEQEFFLLQGGSRNVKDIFQLALWGLAGYLGILGSVRKDHRAVVIIRVVSIHNHLSKQCSLFLPTIAYCCTEFMCNKVRYTY